MPAHMTEAQDHQFVDAMIPELEARNPAALAWLSAVRQYMEHEDLLWSAVFGLGLSEATQHAVAYDAAKKSTDLKFEAWDRAREALGKKWRREWTDSGSRWMSILHADARIVSSEVFERVDRCLEQMGEPLLVFPGRRRDLLPIGRG